MQGAETWGRREKFSSGACDQRKIFVQVPGAQRPLAACGAPATIRRTQAKNGAPCDEGARGQTATQLAAWPLPSGARFLRPRLPVRQYAMIQPRGLVLVGRQETQAVHGQRRVQSWMRWEESRYRWAVSVGNCRWAEGEDPKRALPPNATTEDITAVAPHLCAVTCTASAGSPRTSVQPRPSESPSESWL